MANFSLTFLTMIKVIFLVAGLFSNKVESDSLRMETVNGQTVVIHLVGEKETLYSLSKRYGATVARILEFNPTADGGLEAGQLLKIPYTPKGRVQTAAGTVHKVQPKETLFSISRMYEVTVDELKTWNNLKDNALTVGQEILVKKKDATTTATSSTPANNTTPVTNSATKSSNTLKMTHTVAQGETLYSIARQYGITVDQIKQWNGLQANDLKVSQVVYVAQPMFQGNNGTTNTTTTTTTPTGVAKQATSTVQVTRTDPPVTTTPTSTPIAGSPVKISETVLGTDEVHETGLAELIEGSEGNRKYLAFHRTAKAGSILKVRNEANNREVFVRVAGPLPNTTVNDKLVLKISKSAFDRLGAIDQKFRVEVTYYK